MKDSADDRYNFKQFRDGTNDTLKFLPNVLPNCETGDLVKIECPDFPDMVVFVRDVKKVMGKKLLHLVRPRLSI